ncbi:MAG TPA: uracil-DNA glycosylase [Gaiellaceae bacterium]
MAAAATDAPDGEVLRGTVLRGTVSGGTVSDDGGTLVGHPGLEALRDEVASCTRCPLAATRTQTVFGSGSPTADLMFVGEAPGFHEDKQGVPFVGSAGQLLGKLLGGIGLTREDVWVCNVLKCRPPGNRDPQPEEIAACESHLFRQVDLIRPKVICTLGNFATKLLSGKPDGITKVHGVPQEVVLGGTKVLLFPIFHPAAALYTPRMLDVLKADFDRLPALLGLAAPAAGAPAGESAAEPVAPPAALPPALEPQPPAQPEEPAIQLGLF